MRLFVAIELSDEVKDALMECIDNIKVQGGKGNFTRKENLHITLAFLGETERLRSAKACLDLVAFPQFDISLGKQGQFRDILWVGVEKSHQLTALAEKMRNYLRSAGFDIDPKPFKAHITVAREFSGDESALALPATNSMKVKSINLMSSERKNGRLVYTCIAKKQLIAVD